MPREQKAVAFRLIVRRSRSGLGLGLFARSRFAEGDFVAEYVGVRIPTSFADELQSRYLFEIDVQWTIDGSTSDNIARFINHSCFPNCEAIVSGGRIYIHTLRDVDPGEEITIDYGDEYFDEFIRPAGCRCERCSELAHHAIVSA